MKISGWRGTLILLLSFLTHNQALALEFLFENEADEEEIESSLLGELIYGSLAYGGQIYSLDLQSGEEHAISDWPPVWILSLSRISATRILVSLKEYADPERYKGVKKYDKSKFPDSTNKYWVAVYDFLGGELKIIRAGRKAVYFPEYEQIVYYRRTGDALIIASLDGVGAEDQIVDIEAKPVNNEYQKPMQVSGTEFLYSDYASGSYGIWKYDLRLGKARHLDGLNCRLDRAVWVESMKQLLCEVPAEIGMSAKTYYILTDLAGNTSKEFPWRGMGLESPVISVKNSESVLLTRASLYVDFNFREGLIIDLYNDRLEFYNIKSGLRREILSRFPWMSPDAIIWADK